jgi:hypothetical protein
MARHVNEDFEDKGRFDEAPDPIALTGSVKDWDSLEDMREHEVVPGARLGSNELHADGKTCVLCGQVVKDGQDVRRTASGDYEHERCPAVLS